jgi:mRNA degradation ribonuclease J1/J2
MSTAVGATLSAIPLGGLGEIGMNMMAYEFGDSIIVVDRPHVHGRLMLGGL